MKRALLAVVVLATAVVTVGPASAVYPQEPRVAVYVPTNTALPSGVAWTQDAIRGIVEEMFRADGTPYRILRDADLTGGALVDGTVPRYPIFVSLAGGNASAGAVGAMRTYADRGGFIFAGSTTANVLGDVLGVSSPVLYPNDIFDAVESDPTGRVLTDIPRERFNWQMPKTNDEMPLPPGSAGYIPGYRPGGNFHVGVMPTSAQTLAVGADSETGTTRTILTRNNRTVFYGALQPFLGIGGYDSAGYAYILLRNTIEWAFDAHTQPLIRLAPWRYEHNSAAVFRHDLENYTCTNGQCGSHVHNIDKSVAAETLYGARGDYVFASGSLRNPPRDPNCNGTADFTEADYSATVAELQWAVRQGAVIMPHAGGVAVPAFGPYRCWHWGPDEHTDPTVSFETLRRSFEEVEAWVGTSNPRVFISPGWNATTKRSLDQLDQLERGGVMAAGEQSLGLTAFRTVSPIDGTLHETVTLPVSNVYVPRDPNGAFKEYRQLPSQDLGEIHADWQYNGWPNYPDSQEGPNDPAFETYHRRAANLRYSRAGLVNVYSHELTIHPNDGGNIVEDSLAYVTSLPDIWKTTHPEVAQWYDARSRITLSPSVGTNGEARANVGAVIPGASVDVRLPGLTDHKTVAVEVRRGGTLLVENVDWRRSQTGIRVRAGSGEIEVKQTSRSPGTTAPPDSSTTTTSTSTTVPSGGGGITLNVTSTTSSSMALDWNDVGPTPYKVMVARGGGNFFDWATGLENSAFTVTPLQTDVWRAKVVNAGGVESNIVCRDLATLADCGGGGGATTTTTSTTVPSGGGGPTGLTIEGRTDSTVDLRWNAVSGATEYRAYVSSTSGSGYFLWASGFTGTSATLYSLTGGPWYVVVRAVVSGSETANSNEVVALDV